MSKCTKCGVEMKEGDKFCKSCGSRSNSGTSLNEKKARVMGRQTSRAKYAAIAVVAVIAAAGLWVFKQSGANSDRPMFPPQHDGSMRTTKATPVTVQGGEVRIPVKTVEDGAAHFFSYGAGGKTITFFAMKAPDGTIRTAFDACVACNHAKLGYRQEGRFVVCNNCGIGFRPGDIGKVTGGCNPIPIEKTADGRMLVFKTKDLEAGVQYF